MATAPIITISVVSHRQNNLVNQLVDDVQRQCGDRIALVITENVRDVMPLSTNARPLQVKRITNQEPSGFGANHNAAFEQCETPFFCVSNPDIRLTRDPFSPLLETLGDKRIAVAGPLVRSPAGSVEDSARRFPTPLRLFGKLLHSRTGPDYPHDDGPLEVDWVAGMFMFFSSAAYRLVGGFDDNYFLYYEDVDICRRLRRAGKSVVYDPRAEALHDARRQSRRDVKLALHHVRSAVRFFTHRV